MIVFFNSCSEEENRNRSSIVNGKKLSDKFNLTLKLETNNLDKSLFTQTDNNWKIDFDSIQTIEDYFKLRRRQIKLKKESCLEANNDSIINFTTCVYPYVELNEIDVSLAQIRNNSGSIYYGINTSLLFIPYNQEHYYSDHF